MTTSDNNTSNPLLGLALSYGITKARFQVVNHRKPTKEECLAIIQEKLGSDTSVPEAELVYNHVEGIESTLTSPKSSFPITDDQVSLPPLALGGQHTFINTDGVITSEDANKPTLTPVSVFLPKTPLQTATERFGSYIGGYGFAPVMGDDVPVKYTASPNPMSPSVLPIAPAFTPHELIPLSSNTTPIQTRILTALQYVKSLIDELPEVSSLEEVRTGIKKVELWILQNVPSDTIFTAKDHAKAEADEMTQKKDL